MIAFSRILAAGFAAMLTTAMPAAPQTPGSSGENDFTFKRVKPPSASTTRRITIQVEPAATERAVLPNVPDVPRLSIDRRPARKVVAPSGPSAPAGDDAPWLWAKVSPRIDGLGAIKLPFAMQVLQTSPDARALAPSQSRMRSIADAFGDIIARETRGTDVSPALVLAVISVESAGRPDAKSHAGAVGLMQLMPATAERFGVTDRTDPAQSIRGGVRYLDFLLDEFQDDAVLALAAYNAGEGAVRRAGGVPRYRETRHYVPKVVAAWSRARMHCAQPPMRADDACELTAVQVAHQN